MTEEQLHKSVLQFLRLALPADAVVQHSMNEGRRGFKAQAWLKASGVVAGWPDLQIVWEGHAYFLELKSAKGYLSAPQKACHALLHRAGAAVATVRSLEETHTALTNFGIPLPGVAHAVKAP